MKRLSSSFWHGNIRELQNVIERAVMLADTNMITGDLVEIVGPTDETTAAPDDRLKTAFKPGLALKTYRAQEIRKAERRYLIELLNHTGGRVGEAAKHAGLTPRALYNKMQKYRLKKEYFKRFKG
jgi:DNA-binding NtrC family response regulator